MSNRRYDLTVQTQELRTSAKLLYVSSAKYGGDWHSTLHSHRCMELFYVVGGKGQFQLWNQLLPVTMDDLVIVSPNVDHTEVSLNANPLEYLVLGLEGMDLSMQGDMGYSIVNFRNSRDEILFYLRGMLREIEQKQTGYETVCYNLLELLLMRIMRTTNFTVTMVPVQRRGKKECAAVQRYIENHYKENLTLDDLVEVSHISKYYLVHAFKEEFGTSPINFLIARRIQESRRLLEGTDMSLAQISQALGFSSPSYFSQSFRRLEGMSPMEYRRGKRGT